MASLTDRWSVFVLHQETSWGDSVGVWRVVLSRAVSSGQAVNISQTQEADCTARSITCWLPAALSLLHTRKADMITSSIIHALTSTRYTRQNMKLLVLAETYYWYFYCLLPIISRTRVYYCYSFHTHLHSASLSRSFLSHILTFYGDIIVML